MHSTIFSKTQFNVIVCLFYRCLTFSFQSCAINLRIINIRNIKQFYLNFIVWSKICLVFTLREMMCVHLYMIYTWFCYLISPRGRAMAPCPRYTDTVEWCTVRLCLISESSGAVITDSLTFWECHRQLCLLNPLYLYSVWFVVRRYTSSNCPVISELLFNFIGNKCLLNL